MAEAVSNNYNLHAIALYLLIKVININSIMHNLTGIDKINLYIWNSGVPMFVILLLLNDWTDFDEIFYAFMVEWFLAVVAVGRWCCSRNPLFHDSLNHESQQSVVGF